MAVRVGINGFGRIGRVIFRTCLQNNDIEVSAINDPAITAEYICYLIKFDSTHGKFNKSVSHANDEITVEDHTIKVFHEKLPSSIPWQSAGVQYVVEASGMFTTLDKASRHMQGGGIKRVIVTAPSADVPMIILGVNDIELRPEQKVLSSASTTLYCLAPVIKVLEDHFGISEGFVTSIHAMTPSLKPLDGLCLRGKHWRDHRSIHQNIIPATTGACKALAKIIPQVKDKMSGLAFRVPIVNVSVLDITIRLKINTTLQYIVKTLENASNTYMKNIIKISSDETVSSDYIGESHSCIFDSDSSLQLKSNFYKLICWYENEHSYACRVIDSILFSERQLSLVRISSKMTYVRAKPSKKCDVIKQTECSSEEIFVDCKYNSDSLCATSKDTDFKAKEPYRGSILRKPQSAYISGIASSAISGRPTKRRNEIFKIWNDSNDISKTYVRQNTGSFFHSCISFASQGIKPNNTAKAKERIENVKRDISKVTNITDDLLKKTYNKSVADADMIFLKDKVNENVSAGLNVSKEEPTREHVQNSQKILNSMQIFDICGDCKTRMNVTDSKLLHDCSKEELKSTHDSYNKQISGGSVMVREESSINESDKLLTKAKPNNNSQISCLKKVTQHFKNGFHRTQASDDDSKILCDNNAFKEQVAKAINTLIDGLEQNFQVACQPDNRKQINTTNSKIQGREDFNTNDIHDSVHIKNKGKESLEKKKKCVLFKKQQKSSMPQNPNTVMTNKLEKDNSNVKMALEAKHKVINVNNQYSDKREFISNRVINKLSNVSDNKKDATYFTKQILDGLNRFSPEPVVMIREDNIKTLSPDSISVGRNCGVNTTKQDIYDKLESVSETDSDNSFEIHRRKSEVIRITDLTKSLEDLANLDKICRIIEISDELSDKLFSALNTGDGEDSRQKKWSFKDLCERIKLDEFCNKVFSKKSS